MNSPPPDRGWLGEADCSKWTLNASWLASIALRMTRAFVIPSSSRVLISHSVASVVRYVARTGVVDTALRRRGRFRGLGSVVAAGGVFACWVAVAAASGTGSDAGAGGPTAPGSCTRGGETSVAGVRAAGAGVRLRSGSANGGRVLAAADRNIAPDVCFSGLTTHPPPPTRPGPLLPSVRSGPGSPWSGCSSRRRGRQRNWGPRPPPLLVPTTASRAL